MISLAINQRSIEKPRR